MRELVEIKKNRLEPTRSVCSTTDNGQASTRCDDTLILISLTQAKYLTR